MYKNLVCLAIAHLNYKDSTNFCELLLLLLGNVSLNPGPVQIYPTVNTNISEQLNKKDLYFRHININSLLSKIDELKCIANKNKTNIIRITESRLDHTVPGLEVNLPGYHIL